ncbi:MAG: histidine phosphatase family protein [Ferruginibacter sp.]|nr:histidine phosphatase family protein [Ferruginibacter sp.]
MKTAYIIRHAKSSWDNYDITDFERPLNERGKRDAPVMAKRILDRNCTIDLFVSSSAVRAKETCKFFSAAYGVENKKIIFLDRLYHASPETIEKVIGSVDNKHNNVAVFTHNPGVTEYVNTLIPDLTIDNMPTCGVFCIEADIEAWDKFAGANKRFVFFDYPRLNQSNPLA